jgi:hypothetical protein
MKQNIISTFLLIMDALDKRRIFGPYEGFQIATEDKLSDLGM